MPKNNNETTTKFKVDISELKKNFQEATRQIRLANSEFKAATSGLDNWSKSADGVSAKLKQLDSVLDSQKKQLQSLEEQYKLVVQEQGANSKGAEDLMIKINNQKAAIGNTEKQIRDYNSQLSQMTSEQSEAKTAMDKLKDSIDNQESELKKLKTQYSNTVIEQGESSDAAKDLAKQIDNLSAELKDNKSKLSEAEKAADNFDNTLGEVEEGSEKAGDGFTVMKGALSNLVTLGIKAAIDGFKKLASSIKDAYTEFDVGYDNLIKATGATGETAKNLEKSYKNVSKSIKGDFGTIGSALGEVNTRFGYTGEELENTTVKFMKFAEITGTDATHAVQLVSRAMGDAGINSSKYATVLDELAIAAQASGISVDKLTENLTKYGAPMRALGFETKEAIAIFSSWEKAGVNTEIAFSGMKTAIANWSDEGKDAKIEFKKTLDEIAKAPDIASATTKAIEVFGKKAGPDLADAIKGGRFEYSDFLKIIEGSTGTVENTYEQTQDGFDKISLAAQGLKADVADAFKEMLDEYSPDIEKAINKVKEFLDNAFEKFTKDILPVLKEAFQWIIDHLPEIEAGVVGIGTAFAAWKATAIIIAVTNALKGMTAAEIVLAAKQALLNAVMAANPVGLIVGAIAGLVAAFVVLWNKSDKFRQFWIDLWESIQETVGDAIDKIKEIWTAISEFFIGIWDSIKETASDVWNAIAEFFTAAGDKVKEVWGTITEFFSSIWEGIKSIFSTIAQWINDNVFTPIKEFFQPVIDFFTTAFEIIGQLAEGCWTLIKTVWGLTKDWFNENIIQPISQFFTDLWNGIKEAASAAWETIKEIWDVVSAWFNEKIITPLKTFFTDLWTGIKNAASSAWDGIKSVWNAVSNWFNEKIVTPVSKFFSNMWGKLKTGAKDAWEGIKSVFSKISDWFEEKFSKAWQKVKDVFSTGGKIFDGIKDGIVSAFKAVVNAIIRGINKVIAIPFNAINKILDKIKNIEIAGISPFENLISRLDVPQIPELAKGGVLRKGQVGLLEGDGAEAVVPLDQNTEWLDEIAKRLYAKLNMPTNFASVGSTSQNVTNNFYQTNNSPKALSRLEIYRQSKNLLRMKG